MTICLDLDGTLITCRERQSELLRAAARALGFTLDPYAIWTLKREGHSTRRALERLGTPREAAEAISRYWSLGIEQPCWLQFDRVPPGVLPQLQEWRRIGHRLVIITARSLPQWVVPQLRHLGILPLIDALHCVPPREAASSKATVLVDQKADLFIGDTESDAEGAQKAGVSFIAVASGQRSPEFLQQRQIGPIAESLIDTPRYFPSTTSRSAC